jgi:DNA-binding LytR/AlgR family response regulator
MEEGHRFRALVVDDEGPARRRLVRQLTELGVHVAGEAEDGEQALAKAQALSPDVIFLDVRMPGIDGMTLAQRYLDLPPVVFCTAYDEFALRAFEVNAVDYLLKPVRSERLVATLEKLRVRRGASRAHTSDALESVAPVPPTRVLSSSRGVLRVFDALAITRFWSSSKYTAFIGDGCEQLTEESLSTLHTRLVRFGFRRVHRGELVRVSAVTALKFEHGLYDVHLVDGQIAKVSRRSVSALKRALGLTAGP